VSAILETDGTRKRRRRTVTGHSPRKRPGGWRRDRGQRGAIRCRRSEGVRRRPL